MKSQEKSLRPSDQVGKDSPYHKEIGNSELYPLNPDNFERDFDIELAKSMDLQDMVKYQAIPASFKEGKLLILTSEPNQSEMLDHFYWIFKATSIEQKKVSHKDFFSFIEHHYKEEALHQSLNDLKSFQPDLTASFVFSKKQVIALALFLAAALAWLYFDGKAMLITTFTVIQLIYISTIGYRLLLCAVGSRWEFLESISDEEVKEIKEPDLPVYTILIPIFKEPEVIRTLFNSLSKLDYPQEKLDILLLFEENDVETINAAKKSNPPPHWRFVYIPDSLPKTKPKACAYGLQFARGKYLTIYDAEDIPNPDQLKKALMGHQKLGPNCLCVQASLNYFNWNENLITKLFTLEYSYWFDYILPGLDYFDVPIPLGGTSNHFNTQNLRDLGAWDPFNTTEDADLGLRGSSLGYSIGVINSTTYEEANSNYWNWIRQRSRWLKGYMQTALVYNRHPIRLLRQIGLKNWLSFQLLITGTPLMLMINPLMWMMFCAWVLGSESWSLLGLPPILSYIGFANLIIGNFLGIYMNMLGTFRRGMFSLIPVALLNPFYWLFFHSVAVYKGAWQLISNPFYWEKTNHGISQIKPPSSS